jgi:hypothetical protein
VKSGSEEVDEPRLGLHRHKHNAFTDSFTDICAVRLGFSKKDREKAVFPNEMKDFSFPHALGIIEDLSES